jgi:hypothetical protein
MPIKRRLAKARAHRITPRVLELWVLCTAIQESGADELWEDEGGRHREYLDAQLELDSLLGLGPWAVSPLEVHDGPSPWPDGSMGAMTWAGAQELRREILAAIGDASREEKRSRPAGQK